MTGRILSLIIPLDKSWCEWVSGDREAAMIYFRNKPRGNSSGVPKAWLTDWHCVPKVWLWLSDHEGWVLELLSATKNSYIRHQLPPAHRLEESDPSLRASQDLGSEQVSGGEVSVVVLPSQQLTLSSFACTWSTSQIEHCSILHYIVVYIILYCYIILYYYIVLHCIHWLRLRASFLLTELHHALDSWVWVIFPINTCPCRFKYNLTLY